MYLVISVQRKVLLLTEDGHVRPKIFNNQPFRESALNELEKREGAGTLFVQPIISNEYPARTDSETRLALPLRGGYCQPLISKVMKGVLRIPNRN